jgi:hypothetical protein
MISGVIYEIFFRRPFEITSAEHPLSHHYIIISETEFGINPTFIPIKMIILRGGVEI